MGNVPSDTTPACPLGKRAEVGFGGPDLVDDPTGVAHDQFTGWGQRHRATTARAIQETSAGDALKRRNLQADRGLAVAQLGSRGDEGTRLGDRVERREVTDFHAEPSLRFAHRIHEKDEFAESVLRP